ncbi:MAG: phosphonate ABC transporter ATP-binding protein [Chromatiales bacterium]|nr:phosphonate ABC transporter ATP-binding protein [Chromatiales bacterium]
MIELKDVSITYPGGAVGLHPTSLRFRQGEFTILLGSSGAGKSTLLRSLNFLNRPSAGSIDVEGIGRLGDRRSLHRHRRQTGMIFQGHQLIERLSALQNVLMGRLGYHSALRSLFPLARSEQRIALECLERVGLAHKALERVDRLSGGQQQRVGIARALAQRPKLMLADEPVASLDPATSQRVLSLLQTICREDGLATVISLHQVELAQAFADRVIALAHGRVIFDGQPDQLTPQLLDAIYNHAGHAPAPIAAPVPTFNLNSVGE